MRTSWNILILCSAITALLLIPTPGQSQEGDVKVDQATIQKLIERLDKVEKELADLKKKQGEDPTLNGELRVMLETPYVGYTYYSSTGGNRYLATRLLFVNLSDKSYTIKREDIKLKTEDKLHELKEIPSQMQGYSFTIDGRSHQLRTMQPPKEIKITPGGTSYAWVVFGELLKGGKVPQMTLQMKIDGKQTAMNINEHAKRKMGLEVKRVGPRGGLGLLNVSGELNTINISTLVDEMDKLANQRVTRIVINWTDSAAKIESNMLSWLQQVAAYTGRSTVNNQNYPAIPTTIRELHLASVPNYASQTTIPNTYGTNVKRVHREASEAIAASLRTAYQKLPLDELIKEIQNEDELTRVAALTNGGGRLPTEQLPLLLQLADHNKPDIQKAALTALRHFGEPEAVAKLKEYAIKGKDPFATTALTSLAASRFGVAHEVLLDIFKNEPPESKKKIVQVFAKYPRPSWSETVYAYAIDPNSTLRMESLKALVEVGHPKLTELLETFLNSKDKKEVEEAFQILAKRRDTESEDLAINYAIKQLETQKPTTSGPSSTILDIINRTKDPRAQPLLIKHFEKMSSGRTNIINTLGQIGDNEIEAFLVKQYGKLKTDEKTATLRVLRELQSPEFRQLAGDALYTRDSSLVSTAAQGLQADASPEAVKLLAAALEKTTYTSAWSYITQALGAIGTPDARAALRLAAQSSNSSKKSNAQNALNSLYSRSPGYRMLYHARQLSNEKKWKEAVDQFTLALKLDKDLPEGYTGRAHAYLKLDKVPEAQSDYSSALKLDPMNSLGITGLAITQVIQGKVEEGIKTAETHRSKFEKDQLYAYNTACVYGRALEKIQADEKAPNREKRAEEYEQKAMEELQKAIKLGFNKPDHIKDDPDLKSLHKNEAFQKIINPDEKKPAERVRPNL